MNLKKHFEEKGYAIGEKIFSNDDLKIFNDEFDTILNQLINSGENINAKWGSSLTDHIEPEDSKVIHTHNVQSYSSIFLSMMQNETLLNLIEEIIGPNIIMHHSKLFYKPPHQGSAFPLHQDWSYFPTKNNSMIAAVIHLSESTLETGCIRIVPGSHKIGKLEKSDGHTYIPKIHDEHELEEAEPIIAEPGDVLFFHCFSLHGSMPNISNYPRKTILIQLYAGTDKVLNDNPHSNIQLVLRGFNYHATRNRVNNIKTLS